MIDGTSISLRDRLRQQTAKAHARVDALFGACDLATNRGYASFLRAQAAAWETLRPLLDIGSLARADALRRDLDRLDISLPAPLDIELPLRMSIGHRYVLEGSRLGSTVLLRELIANAPAMAERASAYLTESGKLAPWKHLSTGLQNSREGCVSDAAIVDDALFVFGLFERAWWATDSAQAEVN
ncbi:MAG: biliverdin-producing heme oxygenase [Sphingomonas sp.]|nr:biliverdin-producing heme oxygenase [Sphingomonas sp.]